MRKALRIARALVILAAFTIGYLIVGGTELGSLQEDKEIAYFVVLALATACILLLIQITGIVIRYKKAQKRMTWDDYQSETKSFDQRDYDR